MPKNRSAATTLPDLPGRFVRETALDPNHVSVSQAAKVLGVGRPALSNFLNGNAAVSADMAARIERGFGIPAQKLLDMQAAYDAARARARGVAAATKAYVPPFLGITANEIEHWAANLSARTRLPVFLRTLVNSTGINLTKVDFPGNDDGQRAGRDGVVVASEGTPWVPEGHSLWEFGCDQDPKTKADHDYGVRTKGTSKNVREDSTFVFVTPRRWPSKQKWEEARRSDGQWKDVRVFDASDLEQWLEQSIAAQAWFAAETHRPPGNVHSLDRCWADWANATDPPLPGTLFATAIKSSGPVVAARLGKPPERPTIVAADSMDEGLAFLAQLFSDAGGELAAYRDRVVVFHEPGVLPKLAAGSSNFIGVAATRDVERELAPYCRHIHTIAVYPRNAVNAEPDVVLEPLHDTPFRTSLEEMKFTRDDIERLGRESGHSLTVLRRRLAKVPATKTPAWAADSSIASRLVPFLFAGAWSSTNKSDQRVVSSLTEGVDYPALEKDLLTLASLDDSPVWSIGTYRGVVSKIDLLFAIAGTITVRELETYFDVARRVLSEDDPSLDLPEEKRWAASIHGKTREISAVLRESISETLVLLAMHGNALFQNRLGIDVEARITHLVRDLLTPLTTRKLEAQEGDLPTYAEASPGEFLSILEEDLRHPDPASLGLMRPAESGIFGRCLRTGLLWALESLAWRPGMLLRVALILAKLARVQIDDNWANKPIESLRSIFRAWMPQTEATLQQRLDVVKRLADEVPDVAWQICVDQFGDSHQVGHYSYKPRWRSDGHGFGEPLGDEDIRAFRVAMVEMSLAWKQHNRDTLGDLIGRLHSLDESWQKTVWELVTRWAEGGASDSDRAWVREQIRVSVMSKRAARRRRGRKIDDLKAAAEAAYRVLEPTDVLNKHEWLFRQQWIEESADESHGDDNDYRKRGERIARLRVEAIREIVSQRGVDGVFELAEMGDAPGQIGASLTSVMSEEQVARFIAMALGTESWTRRSLVYGALHAVNDEVCGTILAMVSASVSQRDFAEALKFAPFHGQTWALVDKLDEPSRAAYWVDVAPDWQRQNDDDLNSGVERLLAAKRPRAAFAWVHLELGKMRPALLFRLLSEIATGKDEPPGHYRIDGYHVTEAFKILDASGEFSIDQMAGLEFPYTEVLVRERGVGGAHGVPNLERYVEDHPEFFAEVIAWVFKRSDGAQDPQEIDVADSELRRNRAERGYRLLDALERIPGRNKLGELDAGELLKWLSTVRQSCAALGRRAVGDVMLGQLIANAPRGTDGVWPCEQVRDVLERVQSADMARGIRTGLYNLRGVHFRGEGGDQEREIAAKYRASAAALEFSHPFVAAILNEMANSYDKDAKGQDLEARAERRLRQ